MFALEEPVLFPSAIIIVPHLPSVPPAPAPFNLSIPFVALTVDRDPDRRTPDDLFQLSQGVRMNWSRRQYDRPGGWDQQTAEPLRKIPRPGSYFSGRSAISDGNRPRPGATMDRLTRPQVEALLDAIHERLGYMVRVRERMEKVGFLPTDELYALVRAAEMAMHSLWVYLHYRSCERGSGRPPGA
jgi:hypothetical protein